jgi:chromosomal replication initiation ATPase DnaA
LQEEPKIVKLTAKEMMNHFLHSYKAHNGEGFVMDDYTRPIIEALCLYFTHDARFERLNDGYSLNKGILLQGNVGCGKSSVMHVFQNNQKQSFVFARCVDISREYSKNGYKMFDMYVKPRYNHIKTAFFGQTELAWCFDDLGFETEARHFGKASNIMIEILDTLYSDNKMRGMAHATTNLTATDIESNYGNRIKSRMRQMFNVIAYAPEAPDRRK